MAQLLLDWLLQRYPTAKRQNLKRMLQAGRVTINGRLATKLKQPVVDTDTVRVVDRPNLVPSRLTAAPFPIVHEDADILVINKPPGLLTSTVAREPRPTLLAMVRKYLAEHDPLARVGLIHRLDRDASGLLVFAKNDDAYQSLKYQFFKHTVRRVYTVVVHGIPRPPHDRIESHVVERTDGTVHSTREARKGQHAITEYQVVRQTKTRALLQVILHTGRKHQIRVHLAERGHAVVNDPLYGPNKNPTQRLMLVATELTIEHPSTRRPLHLSVPIPPELTDTLEPHPAQIP